jgi:hypothetical protein
VVGGDVAFPALLLQIGAHRELRLICCCPERRDEFGSRFDVLGKIEADGLDADRLLHVDNDPNNILSVSACQHPLQVRFKGRFPVARGV